MSVLRPSIPSTLTWMESQNGPNQESFSSLNLEEKSSVSCVHFLTGLAPVTRVLLNSLSMCVNQREVWGWGDLLMSEFVQELAADGKWKVLSRVFVENEASRRLLAKHGFREVGIYRKHARLDGAWRDGVIVERLLGPAEEDE